MPSIQIIEPFSNLQIEDARKLLFEYGQKRNFDAALGDYDTELSQLPWKYAIPDGCLMLAYSDDQPVGCVAFRKIGNGICEMKRLYVSEPFLGIGIGSQLIERIIEKARKAGYEVIKLDTHPTMKKARKLYEQFGFKEIPAYNDNPTPGIRFFELKL
ncbi:MAG: GNAT family N-acetyltransferase [Bacteroidetes bacterium]|nr:GNAT family N-acetyltransferase [Bacteroidota bacterium]MDA1122339.1 GNAT family N-acetyltransferase [Bacteroidota bacterium]